jgi:methyl-accepting chemotaxis protein
MAKSLKLRKTDQKIQRLLSVVKESADEVAQAAEDALDITAKIDGMLEEINTDLQEERATEDDVLARFQTDVMPQRTRVENRIIKSTKNLKAMVNLMAAIKALTTEEES